MFDFLQKIKNKFGFLLFFIFIIPASTNYKLINFGFGSGGVVGTTSPAYSLVGIMGEQNTSKMSGTSANLGAGLIFTQQSHVPVAPTLTNPSNWYNKLHIIVNPSNNPSDTKFAIAVSTDNFATDTRYLQNDNTVGAVLGIEDYQTYTSWGDVTGVDIIGLVSGTTYSVKVKAMQGKYTETDFGPVASIATVDPLLNFDIDVSATDQKTSPPFTINFSDLIVNTVVDSPQKIWVDFETNGESGGIVYVYGQNSGLFSASKSTKINSVSQDLATYSEGVGVQSATATQTSGGPLVAQPPYDVTGQWVGIVDTSIRPIYKSTGPIVGGRASFVMKAKSSNLTTASDDYSETYTVVASASF